MPGRQAAKMAMEKKEKRGAQRRGERLDDREEPARTVYCCSFGRKAGKKPRFHRPHHQHGTHVARSNWLFYHA